MEAPSISPSAVGHVLSTCVMATDNHVPIKSPNGLTVAQKENLKDILLHAKAELMGPGCPAPNKAEMARFLQDVFNKWGSGSYHAMPDDKILAPRMSDKTVAIGTLDEDVPTDKEVKAELKRRGAFGGMLQNRRASKHLISNHAIATHSRERMRGAVVKMRASLKNGIAISTQLLTVSGAFLPSGCKMTYYAHMDEAKAKLEAFTRFDQFETEKVNSYNVLVAVFIARNRITTWANGAELMVRPSEEPFIMMVLVETIRHTAQLALNNSIYEAYNQLKDQPEYTLFPGIGTQSDDDPPAPDARG